VLVVEPVGVPANHLGTLQDDRSLVDGEHDSGENGGQNIVKLNTFVGWTLDPELLTPLEIRLWLPGITTGPFKKLRNWPGRH